MGTDLRALEMLVAVDDLGSIGAAARSFGLQQPSVTYRLRGLERHLRLPLLQRSPRGTRLTTEGAAVVGWAREVVAASERLDSGAAALRRERESHVRVSASMTVAEYLIPRWLGELQHHNSAARVALAVCNSAQAAADVRSGDADLGFVEGVSVPGRVARRTFATDELVVLVTSRHPWAQRSGGITVERLAGTPLVVREPGSGTREALWEALASAGQTPLEPSLELGSTGAVKAAVLAGHGPGVLSRLTVAEELATGSLRQVVVSGVDLHRRLRVIWRRDHPPSGVGAELVGCAVRGSRRGSPG